MRQQLEQKLGRRFARLATDAAVRWPRLWGPLRRLMRLQFDRLAPRWDTLRGPEHLRSFELALEGVAGSPSRVLDLGTGTGRRGVCRRPPLSRGAGHRRRSLAPRCSREARRKTPPELAERVRFEQADAARLPFGDGAFELVTLANMIPFFDELARVLAPGGCVVLVLGRAGDADLGRTGASASRAFRRGFTDFADFQAGPGTALLARKQDRV